MTKRERREERTINNTILIKALGFPLEFFSDIHVRIDNRVDFWLSTGNWHLKGQKKEGKSFAQMLRYLDK